MVPRVVSASAAAAFFACLAPRARAVRRSLCGQFLSGGHRPRGRYHPECIGLDRVTTGADFICHECSEAGAGPAKRKKADSQS